MNAIDAILRVDGLNFRSDNGGGEMLVLDLGLATRLGYPRPRKIRELIKRLIASGFLSDSDVRPTVGRCSMGNGATRETTEYWLTEVGALKLTAKSETETAHQMLGVIIHVFRLALAEARKDHEMRSVHRVLLANAADYRVRFQVDLGIEICRLYGHGWDGRGTQPVLLSGVWKRVYISVYGQAAYDEVKRRNPKPCKGSTHSRWFDAVLDKDLGIVHVLARQSTHAPEFWNRLEHHYGKASLQLQLGWSPASRNGLKKLTTRKP